MVINENVASRLYNWKFDQAVSAMDGTETETERELIQALAYTFGNAGFGLAGSMGDIVYAAVSTLVPDDKEE